MSTAVLSSTYFGPVQWYQKLCRYDRVLIEACDTYQKQTFRNRCVIATTQGRQALTVPVDTKGSRAIISDHGDWRHLHWQALQSAYGESPFFEYYEDDLRPFFTEKWEYLYDFNEAIRSTMCTLLDIHPNVSMTTEYKKTDGIADFRDSIRPKHTLPDSDFDVRPYYQVFREKNGFQSNLSILDLLFCMGPESILYIVP